MEILVRKTSDTVQDRQNEQPGRFRKIKFDRRRNRRDRRHSVQEGVIVSLSSREEKRQRQDRRQAREAYPPEIPKPPAMPAVISPPAPDSTREESGIDIVL